MPVTRSNCFNRFVLVVLCASALAAASCRVLPADTPGFRSIVTVPAVLANGSPFLLTVSPAVNVAAVKGTWMAKDLLFFKGKSHQGSEVWYALTGVDVEITPGAYPLTVEATKADDKPLHASVQIPIGAAKYRTRTLTVAPNFVERDAATQKEIAADKEVKDRVFAQSPDASEWSGDFAKPVNAPSFGAATGRVTGPHLHFAARWQGAYLDPAGLFRLELAGKP